MKKLIVLLMAVVMFIGIVGCEPEVNQSADRKAQQQTESAMQESFAQVGMPAINNFQEKKLAKMIYELRDQEKLVCFAYFKSLEGKPVYFGKCIGFGLPYCVQYSNPEKIIRKKDARTRFNGEYGETYAGGSVTTMPQPEPNGLFMPQTLSATWLMMIDPKTGDTRPVYIEPEIIVSPFPLL